MKARYLLLMLVLLVGCSENSKNTAEIPAASAPEYENKEDLSPKESKTKMAADENNRPTYSIVERKDISFGEWRGNVVEKIVRLSYRIRVSRIMTDNEIRSLCDDMIEHETSIQPVNAIAFFFYLPGTEVYSGYTAGKAEWAPYGDWSQAASAATGDYSKHQVRIWNNQ